MIGSELYALTTDILDGEIMNEDFFYQLLNIAKTNLEELRAWNFLKKLDESETGNTSPKSLPTDFGRDYKVLVGTQEYIPVPFEDKHQGGSYRYYLDVANGTYNLLGTPKSEPVYFFYLRFTPELGAEDAPVFPERFHKLLAFYVAGYYQNGVDADDLFARMSPENKAQALTLQRSMVSWDANLSARARNNQIGVAQSEPLNDLSQW